MFIKLLKFLKGYVKIRISGYSPERFMNLCSNHEILLWNIENHCDYYIMCISIGGFFQLKPFLKKTKTRVDVLTRYGLPFLLPNLIKRKIFLFGLFACVLSMFFLSNFIWSIEVRGNYTITKDVLVDYLEKQDVFYGMKKSQINIEKLEEDIRKDYENITWASVRIKGTKLEVMVKENEYFQTDLEISEKIEQLEIQNSDLISDKTGSIFSIITKKGIAQVKKGDLVEKGDILVKGQIPILAEDGTIKKYQYCEAEADIYLEYNYPYKEEMVLPYQKKVFTERKKTIYFIEIFENRFAITLPKKDFIRSEVVTTKKQMKILDDFYLPLFIGKTVIREYQIKEVLRDKEEAKNLLKQNFYKFLENLSQKGVQIIEKNVRIENESKKIVLKGEVTLIERTGKLQQMKQQE